jgi:flagellar hook-length control protein FliK
VATTASLTALSAQPSNAVVAASSATAAQSLVEASARGAITAQNALQTGADSQATTQAIASSQSPIQRAADAQNVAQTVSSTQIPSTASVLPTNSVAAAGELDQSLTARFSPQLAAVDAEAQQRGAFAELAGSGNSSTSFTSDAAAAATISQTAFLAAGTGSATTSATNPQAAPASTPTLASQVADAVVSHAQSSNQNGTTEFRMRLDPGELGPVNVHIVSVGDEVRGNVMVSSESVRQMIESQMPELRQRLEAAGVTVQNFTVTADASGGSNRNPGQEAGSTFPNPLQTAAATTASSRFRTTAAPTGGGQLNVVV